MLEIQSENRVIKAGGVSTSVVELQELNYVRDIIYTDLLNCIIINSYWYG